MYLEINNIYRFCEYKNEIKFSCPFISGYSKYILKSNSSGTLNTYIPFIHKFWLYSLYMPAKENESFYDYMWNYREAIMLHGFQIFKEDNVLGVNIRYLSKEYKPTRSVKADMTALKSFFLYIFDELNNENFKIVEKIPYGAYGFAFKYMNNNYSANSSYGLEARGLMKDALATNITIFDKLIKSKVNTLQINSMEKNLGKKFHTNKDNEYFTFKNFPLAMFEDFIKTVKNPRDQLLYLLCASVGARKSQALNLTFYDVDVKNQKLYLTDPLTNNTPIDSSSKVFMNQAGRANLLEKYDIYASLKPHSLIRFKYPIPSKLETNRELMFLPGGYREVFFKLYTKVLQMIDTRKNPFIFQTETGGRYLPSNASTLFNNNLDKFLASNKKYAKINIEGDLHSLRHMYGVVWADLAEHLEQVVRRDCIENNEKIPNIIAVLKNIVAKKMGITSNSINDYFNRSEYASEQIEFLMEKFGDNMMNIYRFAKDFQENKLKLEHNYYA